MNTDARRRCLETALTIVTKDRSTTYDEPDRNFARIAEMWNGFGLRMHIGGNRYREVHGVDIALAMALLKLARLRHNPHHEDSWVDLAGYAACGMEAAERQVPHP